MIGSIISKNKEKGHFLSACILSMVTGLPSNIAMHYQRPEDGLQLLISINRSPLKMVCLQQNVNTEFKTTGSQQAPELYYFYALAHSVRITFLL